MFSWTMLIVQAGLAVVTLHVLRRRVLPNIDADHHAIINVGLPLIVILPTLFGIGFVQARSEADRLMVVMERAWIPIGAPILCGAFALAIWMILPMPAPHRRGMTSPWTAGAMPIAVWTLTGGTLLLLGAAHLMRLFVGQCLFAIAALLMWFNTPHEEKEPDARERRASSGMLLATLCAAGQGVAALIAVTRVDAALVAETGTVSISASLMVATGIVALSMIAAFLPGDAALRAGGWTATYGVLFGLGVLSLVRLVPMMLNIVNQNGTGQANFIVGRGFGMYAPEALALLVLGGSAYAAARLPDHPRRILGVLALFALAAGGTWRLVAL